MLARSLAAAFLGLLLLCGGARAQSNIESFPSIGTQGSVYPLPDPAFTTSDLWITQAISGTPTDFRIDPLRLGYIFPGGTPPSVPYLYQLWWDNSASIPRPTLKYYDGSQWIPLFGGAPGTVIQINQGDGITLTPNPIVSIGTVACTQFTTATNGCVSHPTQIVGDVLHDSNTWGPVSGITSLTAVSPIVATPSTITSTGVFSFADSGVTPGTYTLTTVTVNEFGLVTAISNGSAGGVSVTAADANIVISPSPGTGTFTVGSGGCGVGTLGYWQTCHQSWDYAQDAAYASLTISGATFTPDATLAQYFSILLINGTCPCTIATPTNLTVTAGHIKQGIIDITQSAIGSETVTWGANYQFVNGTPPVLSTSPNAVDYFPWYSKDGVHVVIAPGALNVR